MNKEELIGKLQMTYVGDRNAFNELVGYYDGLKKGIEELQQENKQLKEEIKRLNNLIDSTTNYYLKTLDKNGSMPDEAVEMFNLLEGDK